MMKVIEDEKHTRLAWINGIDGWSVCYTSIIVYGLF